MPGPAPDRRLGRLGAGAIELADDPQIGGVRVHAQENPRAGGTSTLRRGGVCAEVKVMSVGLHFDDGVYGFHTNSRCRPSRLLPTLMPSLDR